MNLATALLDINAVFEKHLAEDYGRHCNQAISNIGTVLDSDYASWPLVDRRKALDEDVQLELGFYLEKVTGRRISRLVLMSLEDEIWQPLCTPLSGSLAGFCRHIGPNDDVFDEWMEYRDAQFDLGIGNNAYTRFGREHIDNPLSQHQRKDPALKVLKELIVDRFEGDALFRLHSPDRITLTLDRAATAAANGSEELFDAWMKVIAWQFKVSLLGFKASSDASESNEYFVFVA